MEEGARKLELELATTTPQTVVKLKIKSSRTETKSNALIQMTKTFAPGFVLSIGALGF
jgi:hypothetical protein